VLAIYITRRAPSRAINSCAEARHQNGCEAENCSSQVVTFLCSFPCGALPYGTRCVQDKSLCSSCKSYRYRISVFFTLSGYILAVVYLQSDAAIDKKFWLARFARIYLLITVALLLDPPIFS
jgi:hypothetical protein